MRKMEEQYTKYGYLFVMVKREGLIAIYEQKDEESNRHVAYEVFKIQEMKEGFVGPKKYYQPAREVPPNSESWGRLGFTCHGLDTAEVRFQQLLSRQKD